MICCHESFTSRKNERKEGSRKREEKIEVIYCVNNSLILLNWVQIKIGKKKLTMRINYNNYFTYKILHFCM